MQCRDDSSRIQSIRPYFAPRLWGLWAGAARRSKALSFPQNEDEWAQRKTLFAAVKKDYVHHLSSFIMSRQGCGCIQGGVCASFYL